MHFSNSLEYVKASRAQERGSTGRQNKILEIKRNICYISYNVRTACGHMLRLTYKSQPLSGTLVRTAGVSGRALSTPSRGRLKAGLTTQATCSREGGLAPALVFEDLGTSGTNKLFSIYSGTAGQRGLNVLDTTIQCPTELSHFRDRWDTSGTRELECELQRVQRKDKLKLAL
jgi:hypothetical protein